jgi:uncharacterized membrane protein
MYVLVSTLVLGITQWYIELFILCYPSYIACWLRVLIFYCEEIGEVVRDLLEIKLYYDTVYVLVNRKCNPRCVLILYSRIKTKCCGQTRIESLYESFFNSHVPRSNENKSCM